MFAKAVMLRKTQNLESRRPGRAVLTIKNSLVYTFDRTIIRIETVKKASEMGGSQDSTTDNNGPLDSGDIHGGHGLCGVRASLGR